MKYACIQLSDIGEIVEETDEFTKVRITVWGGPRPIYWNVSTILRFSNDQLENGAISKDIYDGITGIFETEGEALNRRVQKALLAETCKKMVKISRISKTERIRDDG